MGLILLIAGVILMILANGVWDTVGLVLAIVGGILVAIQAIFVVIVGGTMFREFRRIGRD